MARKPQTEQEKAARMAENESMLATRRRNTKTNPSPQPMAENTTTPAETTPPPAPEQTAASAVEAVTTEPAPAEQAPAAVDSGESRTYKPFKAQMIKRSYSTPVIDQDLLEKEIPDPMAGTGGSPNTINAAALLDKPITPAAPEKTAAETMQEKTGFNKLSNADQKATAGTTADVVLKGYDQLHVLGRKWVKVKESTLVEKHQNDEIDLNAEVVPASQGQQSLNLYQYFQEFNKQIDQEFVVSEDFKETTRPILERVAAKYGLGMNDEWALAYHFGMDFFQKGAMLLGFKKINAEFLKEYARRHQEIKASIQLEAQRIANERKRIEDQERADIRARLESEERQRMAAAKKQKTAPEPPTAPAPANTPKPGKGKKTQPAAKP